MYVVHSVAGRPFTDTVGSPSFRLPMTGSSRQRTAIEKNNHAWLARSVEPTHSPWPALWSTTMPRCERPPPPPARLQPLLPLPPFRSVTHHCKNSPFSEPSFLSVTWRTRSSSSPSSRISCPRTSTSPICSIVSWRPRSNLRTMKSRWKSPRGSIKTSLQAQSPSTLQPTRRRRRHRQRGRHISLAERSPTPTRISRSFSLNGAIGYLDAEIGKRFCKCSRRSTAPGLESSSHETLGSTPRSVASLSTISLYV